MQTSLNIPEIKLPFTESNPHVVAYLPRFVFLYLRSAILSATMEEYEEVCAFGSDKNVLKVYGANFEFRNEPLSCTIAQPVSVRPFCLSQITTNTDDHKN